MNKEDLRIGMTVLIARTANEGCRDVSFEPCNVGKTGIITHIDEDDPEFDVAVSVYKYGEDWGSSTHLEAIAETQKNLEVISE